MTPTGGAGTKKQGLSDPVVLSGNASPTDKKLPWG